MTLRTRLVGVVVLLVTAALVVSGVLATSLLRSYVTDQVDAQLREFASSPQLLSSLNPGTTSASPSGGGPNQPQRGEPPLPSDFFVSAATTDGTVVRQSQSPLSTGVPELPTMTETEVAAHSDGPFTVSGTDGNQWRVLVLAARNGSVTVARSIGDLSAITTRVALLLVSVGLAVVAASAGAAYLLVRRSLEPLEQVEAAARDIAAGDLTRRVPDADDRTEVGQMSAALNSMLAQLEGAFVAREEALADAKASEERMRAFVADASHELRTPLTAVSGWSELYRQGAVPADEVGETFGRIERESERMSGLVDDLLLLARLDQQRPLHLGTVDLLALATADAAAARAAHPERDLAVRPLTGTSAPVVRGDEAKLSQVLRNLMSNALRYSSGPVVVEVGSPADIPTVRVVDHGPGVPDAEKPRIFSRFYRTDAARSRASGGTGLGLSIVAAIVGAHSGAVAVTDTPGGGATFTVTLPPAP